MLTEAIKIITKLLELFRQKTRPSQIFLNEISKFTIKAEHYKPYLYIDIRKGMIDGMFCSEELEVDILDRDLNPTDKEMTEWEESINSQLYSEQLKRIK